MSKPRILDGDPAVIEAELESMPAGAVVGELRERESAQVAVRRRNVTHPGLCWRFDGSSKDFTSRHLSLHYTPLEVLR